MKKLVLVAVFLLGFSVVTIAQEAPVVEVFGGYSMIIADTKVALAQSAFEDHSASLHGWNASVTINGNKWAGFVADFGGSYGTVGDESRWMDASLYSVMFGPRVTLHRGKVTPFVHALFGYARFRGSECMDDEEEVYTENDFAMQFGGGVDVALSDMISVRPVQVDYFTTKTGLTGDFADHFKYSAGLVLTLGKR